MSRTSARPLPSTPFPTSHQRNSSHRELQRTPSLRTLLSTARTHLLLTPFDPAILLAILAHLPRADCATLLRVNSAFYWLVLPILNTHVVLPTHTQWPRLRPLLRPPRQFWSWLETHPPPSWVRQVDVYPHSSRRCMVHAYEHETDTEYAPRTPNCPERLPFLPCIQTLRVYGHVHTDEGERWEGLVPQCAALQNVRPRKLVLFGAPSASPLTSLPYALLAAVDEYVLVCSRDADPDPGAGVLKARAIASDLAHTTARRATLIFSPHTPGPESRCPTIPSPLESSWAGRLFGELGRQLAHLPLHVRIVNAGAIGNRAPGLDASHTEALLESHLRDALRDEQGEYRPWRRPRCDVEFVSMATYLLDAPDDELGATGLEWRSPGTLGMGTPSGSTPKRPPASLSKSPMMKTPTRMRPAPLKPASRIMSLRTQAGPGSPIAYMAHAVARRASDKIAERRAGEKRLQREAARRVVSEKVGWDENVRWR